jgi:hypothetical protein
MYMETLTQRFGIINGVTPQTINNATVTTTGIDMSKFKRVFFFLYIGANAGQIQAKLRESTDNASFSDLAGNSVSITGKTAASKMETFEVRADQITKRYVQLSVTEANSANVLVAVVAIGDEADAKPGNAQNGTQVDTQSVVS